MMTHSINCGEKLTNCVNCGAILTSCKCNYCGSQYDSSRVKLFDKDSFMKYAFIGGIGMAAFVGSNYLKNKRR